MATKIPQLPSAGDTLRKITDTIRNLVNWINHTDRDDGLLPVYDVMRYGAKLNGVTDDAPAINKAINAAAAAGAGKVMLGRGTHAIASSIDLSGKHNVEVIGWGSGGSHLVLDGINAATKLLWTGATSSTAVVVNINFDNTKHTVGTKIRGVFIDCDRKAGIGVKSYSSDRGVIDDVFVYDYTNIAYDIGVNTTEDNDGGSCQNMAWSNFGADVADSSNTTAIAMQFDGTPISNTNFCNFQMVTLLHRLSKGIVFKNSDNNYMWSVRCEGIGQAVEFQGGADAGQAARANLIEQLSTDGAIIARGTGGFTVGSYDNKIFIDNHNPTPTPTVETGAYLHWGGIRGHQVIDGGHPDLRLLGNEGFAQIILQDKDSTTGVQVVKIRMSADDFLLQQLGDDLSFTRNLAKIDLLAGSAGLLTYEGPLSVVGALTALGSFTSLGIDDNATGERFQLDNNEITLGTSGSTFGLKHAVNDQTLFISGGSGSGSGGNILFRGGAHSTEANDMLFRSGTTNWMVYDDSAAKLNVDVPIAMEGTPTNDDAAAGDVGEIISAVEVTGDALTTATPLNVVSISLTAGDWDVSANIIFQFGATTMVTVERGGISLTSATLPTTTDGGAFISRQAAVVYGAVDTAYACGTRRISLSSTTTVYLVAQCTFTISTATAFGRIEARRVR